MKNQLVQLMEAMIALAKKERNIQWIVVTENVIPPQVSVPNQLHPVHIMLSNEVPIMQKNPIIHID